MTRYTAHGKQVLVNGFHLADCITEEAARQIAEALQAETPPITPDQISAPRPPRPPDSPARPLSSQHHALTPLERQALRQLELVSLLAGLGRPIPPSALELPSQAELDIPLELLEAIERRVSAPPHIAGQHLPASYSESLRAADPPSTIAGGRDPRDPALASAGNLNGRNATRSVPGVGGSL